MGLLQEHAPAGPQDDHLLMLRGPLHDMVCLRKPHSSLGTSSIHDFRLHPCTHPLYHITSTVYLLTPRRIQA